MEIMSIEKNKKGDLKMARLTIALTNLGKYNEGELVFTWLKLPATDEEIQKAFEEIGVANGTRYEEFFISDYETEVRGLKIGEYEDLEDLNELAGRLEVLDDFNIGVLSDIQEALGGTILDALDILESGNFHYLFGIHDWQELAEELVDQGLLGDIPENLAPYIDYNQVGEDLKCDYHKCRNGFLYIA